jgi:septal ring factor EnvC (AmiA/AmiB activator)
MAPAAVRLPATHARGRILAGILVVAALVAVPASAQTVDELNARIADAQAEAQSLGAQIESNEAALSAARQRAAAAAAQEAQLSAVLAEGQARAAELEAEVVAAEARLAETREHLRRARDILAQRLVAIYKSPGVDETEVFLESDGFDDLTTRAELLDRIQEADAGLAERVRQLRDQVALDLAAVEEARDRQNAFNAEVQSARDEIAAARADAEAEAAALQRAQAEQSAALAALRSQVGSWEQQVQDAMAVSAAEAQSTVAGWFGDWAIPQAIVMCESGGNWGAVNPSSGAGGAYQILPSTWRLYGGSGSPQDASPEEQSRIAAQIWADSGSSAWVCAG